MPRYNSSSVGVVMKLTPQFTTLYPALSAPLQELTTVNISWENRSSNSVSLYNNSSNVEYHTPILAHIFMAIYVLFALLIAIFNTVTIVAIVKCPELKTVTNMFVLSLSCADLVLSPTLVFIHFLPDALFIIGIPGTRVMATSLFSLMFTSSGTSLLSILAIAVDRYIAVIHPYSYKQIMTQRRATLAILIIWMYMTAFMTSLIAYYMFKTHPIAFLHLAFLSVIIPRPVYVGAIVSQILICIVASVALYAKIFMAIRKQHHASLSLRGRNPHTETMQNRRITNTMAMVLGALILSWTPYALLSMTITESFLREHEWMIYVNMFSILLLYANSFMNPIIYAARSQAFRRAYWKMMCCTCVHMPGSPGYITVETPSIKSTNCKESVTEAILQNGKSEHDTTEI